MPINPETFDAKESRWGDIFALLESKGIKVYSPTQYSGVCKDAFVVVRNDSIGQHGNYSSDDYRYELSVYVPKNQYSKLEPFVVRVREYMKELYPMIVDERNVSSSLYDDDKQAHVVTMTFVNHRKFNFLY